MNKMIVINKLINERIRERCREGARHPAAVGEGGQVRRRPPAAQDPECLAMPCRALPRLAMPCRALPRLAVPCGALPCSDNNAMFYLGSK